MPEEGGKALSIFKEHLKDWDYELDASKNEEDLKKELIQIVNGK